MAASAVAAMAFALLWPFSAGAQATTCHRLAVSGIAESSSWSVDEGRDVSKKGGRPVYAAEVGGREYLLLFVDVGGSRGRLRASDGAGESALVRASLQRSVSETVSKAVDALSDAAYPTARAQTPCIEGFWVIVPDEDDASVAYPRYIADDCAKSPADITATWLRDSCAECVPALVPLPITCDDSAQGAIEESSLASGGGLAPVAPDPAALSSPGVQGEEEKKRNEEKEEEEGSSSWASGCSVLSVTEGGITGEYHYLGVDGTGYDSWGGAGRTIRYLPDAHRNGILELGGDHRDAALRVALLRANRRLAGCNGDSGWVMSRDGVGVENGVAPSASYPYYKAKDCAEGVLDVKAAWFEVESEGAEPRKASPQPVLRCSEGQAATHAVAKPSGLATWVLETPETASPVILHDVEFEPIMAFVLEGDGESREEGDLAMSGTSRPYRATTMGAMNQLVVASLAVVASIAFALA